MTFKSEYSVLKELVRYRLFTVKPQFVGELINMAIWVACMVLVMGYLMQSFGLAKDFGIFLFGGVLAIVGIQEFWTMCPNLLVDIEGDNLFGYHATLPCTLRIVLLAYVLGQTIVTTALSLFILPLGKILLWNQFLLANVSWLSLLCVILIANLFFAIVGLWTASVVGSMEKLGTIWNRILFPMWFFGGFQFSYSSVHSSWPIFSYFGFCKCPE